MSLPAPLLSIVQSVVNRYLALDPEMSTQLAELEGRCICIALTQPELTLYIQPASQSLAISADYEGQPDSTIRGSATALLAMMRSDDPAKAITGGDVELEGDSRTAQRLSDILGQLEIDWEELASQFMGDFAAHRLGGVLGQLQQWAGQTVEALQLDSTEYLQQESDILPTEQEVRHFVDQVDDLRTDVDRLEARLRRLEHH